MMFVLKLPIVYLLGVVWWAMRPPEPLAPVVERHELDPAPVCPWNRSRRPYRRGPGPVRSRPSRRRVAR
jgi:hypothetical protein